MEMHSCKHDGVPVWIVLSNLFFTKYRNQLGLKAENKKTKTELASSWR